MTIGRDDLIKLLQTYPEDTTFGIEEDLGAPYMYALPAGEKWYNGWHHQMWDYKDEPKAYEAAPSQEIQPL